MLKLLIQCLFLIIWFGHLSSEVYSDRPRISTDDGNLIIESAYDKNLYLRAKGPRATIYIGTLNILDINITSGSRTPIPSSQEEIEKFMNGANGIFKRLDAIEQSLPRKGDAPYSNLFLNVSLLWRKFKTLRTNVVNLQNSIDRRFNNDDCKSSPCEHGGTCLNLLNGFHCLCPSNWEGKHCDMDVNECRNFAGTDLGCQNGATCINRQGSYECLCRTGWYGLHCTRKLKDCSGGDYEMCGHGICIPVPNAAEGIKCICDQGWTTNATGSACLTDVNECEASHGPRCSVNPKVECINLPGTFACGQCPLGYEGDGHICSDINECLIIPNGGCSTMPKVACHNTIGSRICGPCPSGYQGDGITCSWRGSCSINRGGCHPSAKCIENPAFGGERSQCVCPVGMFGDGIGLHGCYISTNDNFTLGCDSNPCGDHGQCHTLVSGYTCVCFRGFSGAHCDVTTDNCAINHCRNGGTCRPDDNAERGFRCECTAQYSGPLCQLISKTCGGVLDAEEGSIVYPLSNTTYNHNARCAWIIHTDLDKVINVTFSKFNLEENSECIYDFLQIHDGRSSASQLIGRFCGKNYPKGGNIISSFNNLYFWFRSDQSIAKDGFALHWTSIKPICGGEVNATLHGHISSPGSPGNYPPNRNCYWKLTTSYGKRIQLHFFEFDIESHPNCSFDYLEIFDGEHLSDPLISKYCNSTQPAPIESAGSDILIHFHSDAYGSGKGFQISYAPVGGVPGCGGYYTQDRGEIASPSFNGKYLNNLICEYKIKTSPDTQIRINIISFKLERAFKCRYDYLKVYDGPSVESPLVGRFCGTTYPKTYISSSNNIFIKFKSDITTSYDGFKLTYETVCLQTLTGDSGIIKSPGYPFNYPENRVCEYVIVTTPGKAISLSFQDFNIEDNRYFNCQYDNVEIRDGPNINSTLIGRYCGSDNIPPPLVSTHNYLYIRFKSDISVSGTGFYANYTTIDTTCGGIYKANTGIINHPKEGTDVYGDEEFCQWMLIAPEGMRIKLSFTRFSLESMPSCHSDYLELIEIDDNNKNETIGKFCGENKPPALTTSSNRLLMQFKSDRSVNLPGFSVSYTFLDERTNCGGIYIKSHGFIYSPGWPKRYEPNRDCAWTLRVPFGQQIKLNITEFDLERPIRNKCDHGDYLEIRNGGSVTSPLIGTYCGKFKQKTITSTTNIIYLRFHSDFYLTGNGFKIEWDGSLIGCGGTLTSSLGSISSPNYPQNYYDNAECFYRIVTSAGSKIHITFEDLQLELTNNCRDDYVEIFDGRDSNANRLGKLCQLSPKTNNLYTSANHAYIKFRSDFFIGGKGFLLHYETDCQNNITGSYGIIESPDYPNNYPRLLNCLWTVNVPKGNKINISFRKFDIYAPTYPAWRRIDRTVPLVGSTVTSVPQCDIDFLQLKEAADSSFGHKLCGSIAPRTFTTKSHSVQIKFVTGSFSPHSGFRLEWVKHGCGGNIQKRYGSISVDRNLTSSGEIECEWLIESELGTKITLTVTDLNMMESKNCTTDAIEIYNGQNTASPLITKICHRGRSTISTTTNIMFIKFLKSSSLKDVYFKSNFDSFSVDSCGGRIESHSGIIYSPNYPKKNYDSNLDCLWSLNVPKGHRIELNFVDLDLYSDDENECDDYINIYEDGYYYKSNYTHRICPHSSISPIISKENLLILQFRTNSYGTAKGFKANFTMVCGAIIQAHFDGIISNEKYMSFSNRSCFWTILAPKPDQKISLTITHMSLPKSNDIVTDRNCPSSFLRVLDGDDENAPLIDEYCGRKIPPTIVSHGSALTVQFGTYAKTIAGNFFAHYTAVTTFCGGSLTSEEGSIASPNYPQSYPVSTSCEWILSTSPGNKVYVTFEHFDLEYSEQCNDDYLEIRENSSVGNLLGVYCGNEIPTNNTAATKLYIKFHSNNKNSRQGFLIHYGFLHGNEITGESGEIASPLFPFQYDGSGEYTWRIFTSSSSKITVRIDRLEIPVYNSVCNNALVFYDGFDDEAAILEEICGLPSENNRIIQTTSNLVYIKLKLDETNSGSLFHLSWKKSDSFVEENNLGEEVNCGSKEIKLVLPGQKKSIESPNYPNEYDNELNCEWIFKTTFDNHLQLIFRSFQLEETPNCFADYISVFSSNTGLDWQPLRKHVCVIEKLNEMTNSSTYMKIAFKSDHSITRKGFHGEIVSTCGGSIYNSSGIIGPTWLDWKNFLGRDELRCEWSVKVRPGRVVKLDFEKFNITNRAGICNIYIVLRNGGSIESPLLGNGKYCGYSHENKNDLKTSSNSLFISYISNIRNPGIFQSFRLRFEEKGIECGVTSTLDDDHPWETISSPNYPSVPHPYSECVWVFTGPPGEILRIDFIDRFDLKTVSECSLEFVEVRDGASDFAPLKGRYCGKNPGSIKTSSNMVYIRYVTELSEPNNGFKANVSIDICGGTIVAFTGEVTSPGYPHFNAIKPGSVCEWKIIGTPGKVFKIKAQDIDLPESQTPCGTKVRIEETMKLNNTVSILKTYCETDDDDKDLTIETFSNEVIFKLFVGNPGWDSSTDNRGFRFTFNSSRSVCGGVITASEGYLTTPGYPRETSLRYCQWLITVPDKTRRIQIELLDAELGIDKHRIGIYNDLKFQSAIINMPSKNESLTNQVFETSGNKLAVYLWLSPLATQHRFKARFSSNEPALCGGSLGGYSGELTSPDIKRSYTCEWHFYGVQLASNNNNEFNTIYVTASVNSSVEKKKRCRFIDPQLQIKSINEFDYGLNKFLCGILQVSLRIPATGMDIKAIQGADSSLQFNLQWKLQPCGGVINVGENPVNILNVPSSYNGSLDCIWTIKIPYRVQVEIKLEGSFQLSCEDEFITIGMASTSLNMGHYCKDKLQEKPLIVPHQTSYVQYHAAVKMNSSVKLIAKIVQNNQCGGLSTVLENTFSSPNYPKDYNSNEECAWELQTDLGRRISLTFVDRFVIENTPNCTKDMIIIYDWKNDTYVEVARLCGRNLPPVYNSTYNKMKVVFRTDSDTELDGFRAQWTTVCGGNFIANEKEQILYSPGYPSAYSPNLNCNYEILSTSDNKIIVKFLDFELEGTPPSCEYDNVTVETSYDNPDDHNVFCGNELPAEIRGTNKIEIRFKTDVYLQRKGFKFSYSLFTCGGQVTDPMILSPGPLGSYDDNLNCTWFIEAPLNKIVVLKLLYIDLESNYGCMNDYLSVYNGLSINEQKRLALLCGKVNLTTPLQSRNNTMLLQFVSDSSVHYKGFKAEVLFSYSESVGCGGDITLSSSDYTLKSPYILSDAVYENYLDCQWIIRVPTDHVIKLDFSMFHIASCKDVNQTALGFSHCDCDYVEVIDGINPNSLVIGRYCGHTAPPQLISTRNLISVRFVTDGEIVSHGFEARVSSQESLCGKTLFEVTKSTQTLISPNYGSIARGLHCSYHFKSFEEYSVIHVVIKNLDIEGEDKEVIRCNKDRLLILNNKVNMNATVGKDFILNHQSDAFYTHAYFYDETLRFPEQFVLCGTKKSVDFYLYGDITVNIRTSPESDIPVHKGFELEIKYLGNCGRNYTEQQGRLQSSYDYADSREVKDCYTLITAPENHTISLYFITVYPDYWNDKVYLEIFDGNKVSSPLLVKIMSEYDDKNAVFSTGRHLLLHNRIVENNQVTFDLNYVITNKGRGCGGRLYNELGRITSPMYPDIYRKRSTCEWVLETPVGTRLLLHFAVYDLGRDCDHNSLQIVDRKGVTLTYCSEKPADYTSTDNYVKIVFTTTLNNGGTGWVADFIGIL